VQIVAELNGAQLAGTDGLEVEALAVDPTGRVRAADHFKGQLKFPIQNDETKWVRIELSLELRPGRYELRVAAARPDGRAAGSVFDEIDVPSYHGELALGALVVGTPALSAVARANGDQSVLSFVPVATRELPARQPLRAGLPLKIGSRNRPGAVTFAATLSGPGSATREILRTEHPAAAFTRGGVFHVDLPVHQMLPGEYQLRVDVSLGNLSAKRELAFRMLPERSQ
jgi:hypothetical protein